jgi:hypothetical protein
LLTRSKPTEIIALIGPFPRGRAQFHFMPDKFHFMPDEFHYMPDKFHLMPDPTPGRISESIPATLAE